MNECLNLIFSRLSRIRRLVWDVIWSYTKSCALLLTNRDTKKNNKKEFANATQNLTRAALRPE